MDTNWLDRIGGLDTVAAVLMMVIMTWCAVVYIALTADLALQAWRRSRRVPGECGLASHARDPRLCGPDCLGWKGNPKL